jgi:hypothetical protein
MSSSKSKKRSHHSTESSSSQPSSKHSSSTLDTTKSSSPSSLFHEVECELRLALPPRRLGEIKDGICEQLNAKLFTYNHQLNGVIIGYRSMKFISKLGQIHFERPYIHFTVSVKFLTIKVSADAMLQTRVNSITADHISLLYCGVFQASLHADRLSSHFHFLSHPLYGDLFIDKRHTPASVWQKLTNEKKSAKLLEKEARRKAYEESQLQNGNPIQPAVIKTKTNDVEWLSHAIRNQTLLQVKVLAIETNSNNFFTITADCKAPHTGVIDNEAIEPSMFALTVDQKIGNTVSNATRMEEDE